LNSGRLGYYPVADIQPVVLMAEVPLVMVVHPSLRTRNVKEFITLAKAHSGEITFGSAGFGSSTHMTGELFEMISATKLSHIPYKGSAPSLRIWLVDKSRRCSKSFPQYCRITFQAENCADLASPASGDRGAAEFANDCRSGIKRF
jgi:tripartite-type tricarboxylate transporter receptor subunit TctC